MQVNIPVSNPTNILNFLNNASANWQTLWYPMALRLFFLLLPIDLAWEAILAVRSENRQQFFDALPLWILSRGFFLVILTNSSWPFAIVNSFIQLAAIGAAVRTPTTPSSILATGLTIMSQLFNHAQQAGMLIDPISGFFFCLAGIAVLTAYGIIAFHWIVKNLEAVFLIRAAFPLLAFGGSRWTAPYAERYFTLVIAAGIRLMVLTLIVGYGNTFAVNWWLPGVQAAPYTLAGVQQAAMIAGEALLFAFLCWQLPQMAAGLLSGAPTLSAQNFSSVFAPVAQSAIAGASMMINAAAAPAAAVAGVGGAATGAASGGFGGSQPAAAPSSGPGRGTFGGKQPHP